MSVTSSRLRSAALVASGSALLMVGLSACGSVSVGTGGGDDANGGGFDVSSGYSDHLASAARVTDEIGKGYLPEALPSGATDIAYQTSGQTTYASWKGGQAKMDGCVADSSTKVPRLPDAVEKAGSVSDIVACGSVHQATAGDYTYYWGPISK